MKTATQEIEALLQIQAAAWNRHDTQAYAALWTDDCSFVNVLGMHRQGRAEMKAELDYLHAGRFQHTQVCMEPATIRLLTPEIALITSRWHMTGDPGIPEYPTRNGERTGMFTHVVQRTAAGWRFVASQNTDILPIPDPLRGHSAVAS